MPMGGYSAMIKLICKYVSTLSRLAGRLLVERFRGIKINVTRWIYLDAIFVMHYDFIK